jgi:uncharacterized membrane protein
MARHRGGNSLQPSIRPGDGQKGSAVVRGDQAGRTQVAYAEYFAGPLPSPEVLFDYDQAFPGAGDRIIRMAELEAEHRQRIDHRVVSIQGRNSTLGIVAGLLLGLSGIVGGVYAVVSGADIAGTGVALTALAALAGVFVTQRRAERREPGEKRRRRPAREA